MPLPARPAVPNPGGAQIVPGAQPVGLKAPSWFPLPDDHAKYLDDILKYWEQKSDTVERYQCKFKRWEYDPVFGPKPGPDGTDIPKSYSEGELHYKKPDKGNFHVKLSKVYVAPKAEGEKATYEKQADEMNEHWVCDGMSVFEFDGRKKQLIERPLPAEMQGKSIADGPLPFLFGAKAATIKQRYWIRVITPESAKNEYWLEAHPKSRHDAANFKLVQVIIDEKDFLPKKLTVFAPNYDPRTNPAKTSYVFEEREVNWNEFLKKLVDPFARAFDKPTAPFGWTKIVEKPEIVSEAPPVEARPIVPGGNQANRNRPTGGAGTQATRPQNSRGVK
jgi:TIGR03009 family protein